MNSAIKITQVTQVDHLNLKTVKTINKFGSYFILNGINPVENGKNNTYINRFNGLPKPIVIFSKIIFLCALVLGNAMHSYSQDCKGTLIINTDRTESFI